MGRTGRVSGGHDLAELHERSESGPVFMALIAVGSLGGGMDCQAAASTVGRR